MYTRPENALFQAKNHRETHQERYQKPSNFPSGLAWLKQAIPPAAPWQTIQPSVDGCNMSNISYWSYQARVGSESHRYQSSSPYRSSTDRRMLRWVCWISISQGHPSHACLASKGAPYCNPPTAGFLSIPPSTTLKTPRRKIRY